MSCSKVNVPVKVYVVLNGFQHEIRRLAVDCHPAEEASGFSEFKKELKGAVTFNVETLDIRYLDEEGDWVTVSTEKEWKIALDYAIESKSLLRVKILIGESKEMGQKNIGAGFQECMRKHLMHDRSWKGQRPWKGFKNRGSEDENGSSNEGRKGHCHKRFIPHWKEEMNQGDSIEPFWFNWKKKRHSKWGNNEKASLSPATDTSDEEKKIGSSSNSADEKSWWARLRCKTMERETSCGGAHHFGHYQHHPKRRHRWHHLMHTIHAIINSIEKAYEKQNDQESAFSNFVQSVHDELFAKNEQIVAEKVENQANQSLEVEKNQEQVAQKKQEEKKQEEKKQEEEQYYIRPDDPHSNELKVLKEMGFTSYPMNKRLLLLYKGDLQMVIKFMLALQSNNVDLQCIGN